LKGSVPIRAMKMLAERTAETVTEAENIENRIKVDQNERTIRSQMQETFRQRNQKERARAYGQINEGMDVVGLDGMMVGRVKEVHSSDFILDREMARDLHVPFDAINSVGSNVVLNINSEEVSSQNWKYTELL